MSETKEASVSKSKGEYKLVPDKDAEGQVLGPHQRARAIVGLAYPNGVPTYLREGSSVKVQAREKFHRFLGIRLFVTDGQDREAREVNMRTDGTMDLNAIREKAAYLHGLVKEIEAERDERDRRYSEQQKRWTAAQAKETLLRKDLNLGDQYWRHAQGNVVGELRAENPPEDPDIEQTYSLTFHVTEKEARTLTGILVETRKDAEEKATKKGQ